MTKERSLSRTITVITPENIVITYQAAGIASRFLAMAVDLLLQFMLILAVSGIMRAVGGSGAPGIGSIASAFGIVLIWLLMFGYALFFEACWAGRTPGKRLLGLRVVRDGGYPLTFLASAVRNLLRIVDFGLFPLGSSAIVLCGLPGLLAIFFSPSYKRLGDYAAGTVVIIDKAVSPLGEPTSPKETPEVAYLLPSVRNIDRLTPEEYEVIRRFTSRRHEFDITIQAGLGERLARPLMEKLELTPSLIAQIQYADLLEAIERRYAVENGLF